MGTTAYKRGVRDYENGWMRNPYILGSANFAEWQQGQDDAADAERERKQAEHAADQERRRNAWGVPERAMNEWLEMVDVCGEPASRAILDFVKAYCRVEDDE